MIICPWKTCAFYNNGACLCHGPVELVQVEIAATFEDILTASQLETFEQHDDNYLLKCKNYTLGGKRNE